MNRERTGFTPADVITPNEKSEQAPVELEASEDFDLMSFFDEEVEKLEGAAVQLDKTTPVMQSPTEQITEQPQVPAVEAPPVIPDLLLTLRDDANESIATITTQVSAESFAAGASLTSSIFSTLGSLVGKCGVFCAHSLSALGQAGSGFTGSSALAGLSMPGFSIDSHGNFRMDGNVDSLSRATGISRADLLAGKFSADEILTRFFAAFGDGLGLMLGFGLLNSVVDCLFSAFLSPTNSQELALAA